jgi:Flp pilus assembly pilin Flp
LFGAYFRPSIGLAKRGKGDPMFYAVLEYLHAALWRANVAVTRRARAIHALAEERGQGTVEYVGLILLVSLLMVGMVAAMKGFNGKQGTELADVIINKIKEAVD